MTNETRIHPGTGQTLHRDVRTQTIIYAIYERMVEVPGWYPDNDGDAIHSGDDLAVLDTAYRQMRSDYAVHLRQTRKSLKLSQVDAGRIIGGGKRAFQKYESGKLPPSDAAVGLIEILRRHPDSLSILKTLPGREPHAA